MKKDIESIINLYHLENPKTTRSSKHIAQDYLRSKKHNYSYKNRFEHLSIEGLLDCNELFDEKIYESLSYEMDTAFEDKDLVRYLLSFLSKNDKKLYTMYILKNMTHKELAERFGKERSTISKRLKEIQKCLNWYYLQILR